MNPVSSTKGVIFDMDGTLISTEAVMVHRINKTSKKYLKRALPKEDPFWALGPPARNIIRGFADSLPSKPVREAINDYHLCYRNSFPARQPSFREFHTCFRSFVPLADALLL